MFWEFRGLRLEITDGVYQPAEDSTLLAEALEKELAEHRPKSVLDMGCGSGILGIIAAKADCTVTSADINQNAVHTAEKNGVLNGVKLSAVVSDLFESIKGTFDLIVFNSPYLPDKDRIKGAEMWADEGTIERFIDGCFHHLNRGGTVLLLISSLSGTDRVLSLFKENGFKTEVVAKRKIPWEELMVIRASL